MKNRASRQYAATEPHAAFAAALAVLGLAAQPAHALQYSQGRYSATLEGFGNLAGGYASGDKGLDDDVAGFGFGELRLLVLAGTGFDLAMGPRVTYRGFRAAKPMIRRCSANAV
jgi:hypothetical protein